MITCIMSSKGHNIINRLITVILVFGSWHVLSQYFSPLVLPPINNVFFALVEILTTKKLYMMIFITLKRLIFGLCLGMIFGLIMGITMGYFKRIKNIFMPIVGIMQTVPPVSWVVLALVWFGFNGKPAIFIVTTATLPIFAINVCQGIENIDKDLLEMAMLYKFPAKKKFVHVIFPSISACFKSAFKISLGSGWKIAVMGEVLTTNDGIGGMIKQARLNIEPEAIIAWSVIVVVLFYMTDFITILFRKKKYVN